MKAFVLLPLIAALSACGGGSDRYQYAQGRGSQSSAAGYVADPMRTAGVQASPANASLSDEQSFDAVAGRETIESDAARRAQQAAAYHVIEPVALPQRTGQAGPNIVAYALQTSHAPGRQMYSRFLARESQMRASCARYGSDDEAQRAFLAGGGPERNYQGMDPDGDGFACGWDPRPFRLVAVN